MAFTFTLPVSKKVITWDFLGHRTQLDLLKQFPDDAAELSSKMLLHTVKTCGGIAVTPNTFITEFDALPHIDIEAFSNETKAKRDEILNPMPDGSKSPLGKE